MGARVNQLRDRTAEKVGESWLYRAAVAVVWGIATRIVNRGNR